MKNTEQDEYAFVLSTASLLLAEKLTRAETNVDRKAKENRVCNKKAAAIDAAFAEISASDLNRISSVHRIQSKWTDADRTLLLIDLAFTSPFFPYELKFNAKEFEKSFVSVALLLSFKEATAYEILAIKKDALQSHKESRFWPIALTASAVAAVCALGGYLAAPVLAAKIGAAAGLYGAAATSYGLALLGGGSLAAGGLGMAGGLWIVTGVSATVAGALTTGGQLLFSMGADQARGELIKLQVSYKAVLLQSQRQTGKTQKATTVLIEDKQKIAKSLKEEKTLNDSDSTRVKDLEQKIKAIQTAVEWMEKQEK